MILKKTISVTSIKRMERLPKGADSLFNHVSRFSMGNDMADYNNAWLARYRHPLDMFIAG